MMLVPKQVVVIHKNNKEGQLGMLGLGLIVAPIPEGRYFYHDIVQVLIMHVMLFTSNAANTAAKTAAIRFLANKLGEQELFYGSSRLLNIRGRGKLN